MTKTKRFATVLLITGFCLALSVCLCACGPSKAQNSSKDNASDSEAYANEVVASDISFYFDFAEEGWYYTSMDITLKNNTETTFENAVMSMIFAADDGSKTLDAEQHFPLGETLSPGEEKTFTGVSGFAMKEAEAKNWGSINSVYIADQNNKNRTMVKNFPENKKSEEIVAAAKETL